MRQTLQNILMNEDLTGFLIGLGHLVAARRDAVGFDGLTDAERVALVVDELEREMNLGGFDRYFQNNPAHRATQTVNALEQLGALHTADIVRRAVALAPFAVPVRDPAARQNNIEERSSEVFLALDREFYRYQDNLAGLMRAFAEAHASEFPPSS